MAVPVYAMAATIFLSLFLLYEYRLYPHEHNTLEECRDCQNGHSRRSLLRLEPRPIDKILLPQQYSKAVWNKGKIGAESKVKEEGLLSTKCDIFSGSWVKDESYPVYGSQQLCPYLSAQYNCKSNGRPDSEYLKWRWQPQDCNIPRFNANEMLEILRGKRLMFVGDSLTRNQWESMVCMLQAVVPDSEKVASLGYPLAAFKALNYNASVEFYWAPFLVDLDNAYVGNELKRVLRIDSIENNANYWRGVDILVFNSAHWWAHTGTLRSWDYIQLDGKLYQDMDPMLAYANGLATWANWIDFNINSHSTQVFFTSISPTHMRRLSDGNEQMCMKQTEPIQQNELYDLSPEFPQTSVVEGILPQMTVPVSYLNITRLSDYRKDAHPSVYTDSKEEQRSHSDAYADCSHWCVSGVPDIWNELLFSLLQRL
ncbi:hypothetical protein SUGI_0839340 [Cryptomeria japonica]|uniref:protein trichome birefringence-like 36 n=1 Tax=Cryptomeria japonica TaxID=3369 RepID=UPI00241494AE|nr:protein trichome birefringence-like 36 [Cryptomeria japonica]GLJ40653.1 hypothetical protein SUGI_0839340 [Cryptomeria japonica]